MAASGRLCDICETRDITVFATDWCPECEQCLCESCKSHHSAFKSSKTHETISLESFNKLPSAVQEITNDCSEHGARFEYYCNQHEAPCCVECMKTTHAECRHLTSMHKVVEHFKTSNSLSDFHQTLSDLLNNLNSLIKSRFDNILLLAEEKDKCLKEIADIKRNFIAHLDQLETKLKTEVEVLHQEHSQAIKDTIREFEDLKANVAKMQDEADVIKKYASDFQLFLAFREFDSTVKNLEKDLANGTLLPSLGNVNMITEESAIKLVNHRDKQAQLLATGMPSVDKIQLKSVFENVQLPSGKEKNLTIWDICFLSHGRLGFSDQHNKRLILLKENGGHDRDINLTFMPSSIAYITDNETAVGKYEGNEINIINMTSLSVDRSFAVKGYDACAFSFRKGQFLVTGTGVGFCFTDIDGNILREIPYNGDDILYAVLLDDKIYVSQHSKNRIVCCNLKGE
ncbi:unnamed protein product [Mytilus edulis]|uniref:B box-type domain-containing protein n=1 Tax=Mytilus edulis TaxID=6550 RepID=A0A8S3TY37_MYTED|nr:unnamed protein product [Mytilus edulis]